MLIWLIVDTHFKNGQCPLHKRKTNAVGRKIINLIVSMLLSKSDKDMYLCHHETYHKTIIGDFFFNLHILLFYQEEKHFEK